MKKGKSFQWATGGFGVVKIKPEAAQDPARGKHFLVRRGGTVIRKKKRPQER